MTGCRSSRSPGCLVIRSLGRSLTPTKGGPEQRPGERDKTSLQVWHEGGLPLQTNEERSSWRRRCSYFNQFRSVCIVAISFFCLELRGSTPARRVTAVGSTLSLPRVTAKVPSPSDLPTFVIAHLPTVVC